MIKLRHVQVYSKSNSVRSTQTALSRCMWYISLDHFSHLIVPIANIELDMLHKHRFHAPPTGWEEIEHIWHRKVTQTISDPM